MPAVRYSGSPYHKLGTSLSDKTLCPPDVTEAEAIRVLTDAIDRAIDAAHVSALRDGPWPRYAWGVSTFQTIRGGPLEVVWEARLVERGGDGADPPPAYKAYPVSRDRVSRHLPRRVRSILWPGA